MVPDHQLAAGIIPSVTTAQRMRQTKGAARRRYLVGLVGPRPDALTPSQPPPHRPAATLQILLARSSVAVIRAASASGSRRWTFPNFAAGARVCCCQSWVSGVRAVCAPHARRRPRAMRAAGELARGASNPVRIHAHCPPGARRGCSAQALGSVQAPRRCAPHSHAGEAH